MGSALRRSFCAPEERFLSSITFQELLGAPTALMGFAFLDDRIHAPNEKFHLPNFVPRHCDFHSLSGRGRSESRGDTSIIRGQAPGTLNSATRVRGSRCLTPNYSRKR